MSELPPTRESKGDSQKQASRSLGCVEVQSHLRRKPAREWIKWEIHANEADPQREPKHLPGTVLREEKELAEADKEWERVYQVRGGRGWSR